MRKTVMSHIPLPIFLPLAGRKLVIVGGGDLALRKLRLALKTGADIHLFATELHEDIGALAKAGTITWIDREFRAGDLEGASAVFAATGDEETEKSVARAARQAGVPVNAVDRPEISSFTMGSIIDRAPVVIGISTDGAAPVLARRIKTMVERAIPERLGDVAAFARRFRDTVSRLVPTERARRAFWERFFDGPVAELVLAGREPEARAAMIAEINGDRPAAAFGKVMLVGAGPGDPELLTIKAGRALQEADVILFDRLVPEAVLEHARRDADRISVGKMPGGPSVPQEETNALMAQLAAEGKTVVRLKAGDPFVFGRGGEEQAYLEERGITVEIVPGITAAIGCAAEVGLPLTHRDHTQTVTFVTAHGRDGDPGIDWQALAALKGTLAVYMGVRQAPATERNLLAAGLDGATPVAIAQNGTQPGRRLVRGRLDNLAGLVRDYAITGPAIIYIGETAALGIPGEEADAIHSTPAASERRAIAGA
jgi:uroporphyrin-III C-methyltransferase/precorrin-2 dehydrogenase/sirohydrochlorin ferrochelatase